MLGRCCEHETAAVHTSSARNALASVSKVTEQRTSVGSLSRRDGVGLCVLVALGFVVGEVLGVVADSLARVGFHDHLSLVQLSQLAKPPWWFVAAGLVGLWVGFLLAVAVAAHRYRVFECRTFSLRVPDLWFVAVGVVLQFGVGLLYTSDSVHHVTKQENSLFGTSTGVTFVVLALMTAIGAPIVEELLFRGFLLAGLRRAVSTSRSALSTVLAVVLDGLLFSAAHAQWSIYVGLAIVGVVLAAIYVRTHRLVPCMLTHAGFNALAVIALVLARSPS
jgi:membrane protease YdiL (CAAX protease family)